MNQKGVIAVLAVVLVGVLVYFSISGKNNQPAVPTVSVQQSVPAKDDAGSASKTYQNQRYGFEFRYPKAWMIDQERTTPEEVVFDTGAGVTESREAVAFMKNDKKLTLEQLKTTRVSDPAVIVKQSEMTVGGERTLVIETTEFGTIYVIFNHGDDTYVVTTGGSMMDEGVLSSFVFTK